MIWECFVHLFCEFKRGIIINFRTLNKNLLLCLKIDINVKYLHSLQEQLKIDKLDPISIDLRP